MLVILLLAFIAGGVAVVVLQAFWIHKKFRTKPPPLRPKTSQYDAFQLPPELSRMVLNTDLRTKKESCLFLNLITQFLFRELKDTNRVRKWFLKKLNVEFEELLQTTSGKLVEQITVQDLNLGTMFPVINSILVKHVLTSDDDQSIEELDLCLDIDYKGGIHLAVQADLVFGRSAYLFVKLVRLKGLLRIQLTRLPFAHWSISFYNEPAMEFDVESRFEGHVISQLTSLIVNQIRRSIRKKHTLPNYKMRFKPFFSLPEPPTMPRELKLHGHTVGHGHFSVMVIECSRLIRVPSDSLLYCTVNIGSLPWPDQRAARCKYVTFDLEINKTQEESFGLVFKEEFVLARYEAVIIVDSILPDSPAFSTNIRKRDIVVSVNGQRVITANQAMKIMEASPERLTLKLDRAVSAKKDCKFEENIVGLQTQDLQNTAKTLDVEDEFVNITIMPSDGLSRKSFSVQSTKSAFAQSSRPSSAQSSKPSSAQSTPELRHRAPFSTNLHRHNTTGSDSSRPVIGKRSVSPAPSFREADGFIKANDAQDADETRETMPLIYDHFSSEVQEDASEESSDDDDEEAMEIHKTTFVMSSTNPLWNEMFEFESDDTHVYLNACVWCKSVDKLDKPDKIGKPSQDFLLGYVSLALCDVALECLSTLQGDTQKTMHLSPSDDKIGSLHLKPSNLSSHAGFEPSLCYGDITLEICHNPEGMPTNLRKRLTKDPDLEYTTPGIVASPEEQLTVKEGQHNFLGTHFSSATYCNFCGKKIWLKVAYQCSVCNMICHKKCTDKCRQQTLCTEDGARHKEDETRVWTEPTRVSPLKRRDTGGKAAGTNALLQRFRRDLPNIKATAKNKALSYLADHSIKDLSPPIVHRQRRNSAPEDKPECPKNPDSNLLHIDGIPRARSSTSINTLATHSSDDQSDQLKFDTGSVDETGSSVPHALVQVAQSRLAGTVNEIIVTSAKEKGRELYSDLSLEERKEKLDAMVTKLQLEIDTESEHRADISRSESETTDPALRLKLQTEAAKSEERLQALMVLMVHYCAGLQHCMDLDQRQCQLDSADLSTDTPNKVRARHPSSKQRSSRRNRRSENGCPADSSTCDDNLDVSVDTGDRVTGIDASVMVNHVNQIADSGC